MQAMHFSFAASISAGAEREKVPLILGVTAADSSLGAQQDVHTSVLTGNGLHYQVLKLHAITHSADISTGVSVSSYSLPGCLDVSISLWLAGVCPANILFIVFHYPNCWFVLTYSHSHRLESDLSQLRGCEAPS